MPARDSRLVVARCEDELALLAFDDGGAGVLAAREHSSGSDDGVLEQLGCYEMIVGRRIVVVENVGQLLQV